MCWSLCISKVPCPDRGAQVSTMVMRPDSEMETLYHAIWISGLKRTSPVTNELLNPVNPPLEDLFWHSKQPHTGLCWITQKHEHHHFEVAFFSQRPGNHLLLLDCEDERLKPQENEMIWSVNVLLFQSVLLYCIKTIMQFLFAIFLESVHSYICICKVTVILIIVL